ncbi:hypothetical protein E2C01_101452 [Portunus trituberculatus]|uniref:Uncharacterized protein n=1 Tax=Portunus trituberculatus TaxID=210409 RepID=A0A5B7KFT1_PORTR|nr:hypothetical protein [Portunus trituberculatus]
MSSCTVFVFFSLMEYALVNVVLGDVPEEPDSLRRVRSRALLHVTPHQVRLNASLNPFPAFRHVLSLFS